MNEKSNRAPRYWGDTPQTPRVWRARVAATAKTIILLAVLTALSHCAWAQVPDIRYGTQVPAEVTVMYDRGLSYLAKSQGENGAWSGRGSRTSGQSGITGMCVMAFLASGEDPNFGKYALVIRRALQSIIQNQNEKTGYLGGSMYHHGFGMLGLAEAYGAVDESRMWNSNTRTRRRGIGEALELSVRCAVTSQQKNQWGGWRYSPQDTNADTSVSGAVLMGLLAARNAGIEVPDTCIDKALSYFRSSTSTNGSVAYTGGGGGFGDSMNRSSIATLVYSIGKKKDWDEYRATLAHITSQLEYSSNQYPFYFRYYMAQALFQGDSDAWRKWNSQTIRQLKQMQVADGSFDSGHGKAYGTSMSLLALALNYRFLPIYER